MLALRFFCWVTYFSFFFAWLHFLLLDCLLLSPLLLSCIFFACFCLHQNLSAFGVIKPKDRSHCNGSPVDYRKLV